MADKKVSELPNVVNLASTDKIVILYNASSNTAIANGSPSLRTMSVSDFSSNIVISNTVPSNTSSEGIAGNISADSNYLYVCVANNSWKRASLSTW